MIERADDGGESKSTALHEAARTRERTLRFRQCRRIHQLNGCPHLRRQQQAARVDFLHDMPEGKMMLPQEQRGLVHGRCSVRLLPGVHAGE